MFETQMKKLLFISSLVILSCNSTIDIEKEKTLIKEQIERVHQAHLDKDAQTFYQPNADSWIDIRNGKISRVNKSDVISGTQEYLNNMEFAQLKTIGEPIIEVSNDASLATYSSSVLVKGRLNDEPILWVVAWQNTLKKIEGEWKIISAVNTEANNLVTTSTILDEIRNSLGEYEVITSISALADCTDPENNSFTTLIYSNKENGRMEQISGDRHTIFKHGQESWGKNVVSETVYDSLNDNLKVFAKSHELHWLSLWPETRYSNPTFNGIVDFGNEKALKVSFEDDLNKPVNFYYDFESYLPLAFDIEIDNQGNTVTTYFENWKEKDSVKMFNNATFDQMGMQFKYSYSEINLNSLNPQDFDSKKAVLNQQP